MIQRILSLLLPVFAAVFLIPPVASAQFEGTISLRAFEPDQPDVPQRVMEFVATPQRLLLTSNYRYRVFRGMDASGILVRNDRSDFIFLSGDTDALRFSTDDLESFTTLLQRVQGSGNRPDAGFDWDGRLEETGEIKTIRGYRTEQIKVYEENSENHISVWLTEDIRINWGILHETWNRSLSNVIELDIPIEVFMNRNSFPLQIEYYVDGRLETFVEATSVTPGQIAPDAVELSPDVQMMGIADLMMRMMRDRR